MKMHIISAALLSAVLSGMVTSAIAQDAGANPWKELEKELRAEGIGREKWGELFRKGERGEALEPKEAAALQRIVELKERMDRERKVLDRWIGTWVSDVIIRPSAWVPDGKQQSEIREVKWILNGRFQQSTIRSDDHESREIQRYDVGGKRYHRWTFGTEGFGHGYWTGSWDEESKAMTWKLDFGVVKGTMVDSFADPDPNYVTTLVLEDAEGKVLLDSQTEHMRVLKK